MLYKVVLCIRVLFLRSADPAVATTRASALEKRQDSPGGGRLTATRQESASAPLGRTQVLRVLGRMGMAHGPLGRTGMARGLTPQTVGH